METADDRFSSRSENTGPGSMTAAQVRVRIPQGDAGLVQAVVWRRGRTAPQSAADLPRGRRAPIRVIRGLSRFLDFLQPRKFPNEACAPRAARCRLGFRGRGHDLPDFAALGALELQDQDLAHLFAHYSPARLTGGCARSAEMIPPGTWPRGRGSRRAGQPVRTLDRLPRLPMGTL
jgi:hypothetical protein